MKDGSSQRPRETTSLLLVRIFCAAVAVLIHLGLLYSGNDPLRVVEVKVVADEGYQLNPMWQLRIKKNILSAQRIFRKNFGIRLHIQEFSYWCSNPTLNTMADLLRDLIAKVSRNDCDIVLGLVPQGRHNCPSYGISSYPHGYVLVQELKSNAAMEILFKHELCHIFGAVDLKHKGSIMDMDDPGLEFDAFTRRLIIMNRNRSFSDSGFPLDESRIDQVVSLMIQRTSLDLGETEVHLILAFLLLEKGEYESALVESRRALDLNPALDGIHHSLGISYQGRGESDKAVEEYQKVLRLKPDQPNIYFNLGLAYYSIGKDDEALDAYKKALEIDPDYPQAHTNLGWIYFKRGEIDEAIKCCRKAIESNPTQLEALCTLGAALIVKYGEARGPIYSPKSSDENGYDPLDRPNENFLREYKRAYLDEAIAICQKAVVLRPDLSEPHNVLGVALAYCGDKTNAEAEFIRAVDLKPEYLAAHFNLGLLYQRSKTYEKSAVHFSKTVEIDSEFALGYHKLAEVFLAMSQNYSVWAREKGWKRTKDLANDFIFANVKQKK